MEAINIGKRREVFWDETVIDMDRTGSAFIMHEPVKRECVVTHKHGGSPYMAVIQDGDTYRMYCNTVAPTYCESKDGIHWYEPNIGEYDYKGSKDNNYMYILDTVTGKPTGFDGFRPFVDTNPECKPEERIKAVANHDKNGKPAVWLYTSPDGIHFKEDRPLEVPSGSSFDSVNTLFFNNQTGTYQLFFRDFHMSPDPYDSAWPRSISMCESKNVYGRYTRPQLLQYDNPTDWQMYTNSVMKYYRADHVYIGFPSRYIERNKQWEPNYDDLCGYEERRKRYESGGDKRFATAISDTMFMTSRDGHFWKRYPDAFLRPGPEYETNWVYGSVYFSNGIVETPSEVPGADNEISFYCAENRWFDKPLQIYRYTMRLDGFVSQWGPWHGGATLTTKPIIFDGKEMYINFSTSAFGGVQVTIENLEDHKRITSCDMMGDSCDRHVHFGSDLSEFAGKPCVVSFKMRDADIYSMIFRD